MVQRPILSRHQKYFSSLPGLLTALLAPRVPLFSETRKNGKKVRQELVHECRCYRQQIEITGENRKKEEERKNLEKLKNDQENKIEKTSAGANK